MKDFLELDFEHNHENFDLAHHFEQGTKNDEHNLQYLRLKNP